jgi:sugar lactone lactonase YvrE
MWRKRFSTIFFVLISTRLWAQLTITVQPARVVVSPGGMATFSVTATGDCPLTYQWQFNGTNLSNGIITTVAGGGAGSGSYTGDGGPANQGYLAGPTAVVADSTEKLIIADQNFNRIRQVSPVGIIDTIGGTGTAGFSGDGGAARNAKLNSPFGVVMDAAQNVFFSDSGNHRVRKIDANGIITTVAGNGTNSFAGDNGPATNASLNGPAGLAIDGLGNLFIADYNNYRIRKVGTNGIITTVAGSSTNVLYAGNGGYATNAGLYRPRGVAVDAAGNLFIADTGNNRIRKVDTNGIITLLAGTNSLGFSGDGGLALTNKLALPAAVAVDGSGNVFIADEFNTRIRKIDANGIMTTVAGNDTGTFAGDGGPATNASLSLPIGISVDSGGNLLIADFNNFRVRKVIYSDKPTLTVFGVNSNNIGDYQVVVSGACGSVTSSVVKLVLPAQIQTGNASLGVQENGFGFAVTGSSNQMVVIEASANLDNASWQPVATNTLGADPYYFSDPEWTNNAQRFYRVQTP